MCKPASMIITNGPKAHWSETTDSHHEIITEHALRETDARGDICIVPVEISPKGGNLSLPLKDWVFKSDHAGYERDLPEWWDIDKAEAATRSSLKLWAKHKLTGWNVKEAFAPVNPLKVKADESLDKMELLRGWGSVYGSVGASVGASVMASVGDSVRGSVWGSVYGSVWGSVYGSVRGSVWDSVYGSVGASVGGSVGDSVMASVGDSVRGSVWVSVYGSVGASVGGSVYGSVYGSARGSVWDSVGAYIGSLFTNITEWKYLKGIKNPWASLRKLWLGGYVPSFDGKTWRLHAGINADIVFEISKEDLFKD